MVRSGLVESAPIARAESMHVFHTSCTASTHTGTAPRSLIPTHSARLTYTKLETNSGHNSGHNWSQIINETNAGFALPSSINAYPATRSGHQNAWDRTQLRGSTYWNRSPRSEKHSLRSFSCPFPGESKNWGTLTHLRCACALLLPVVRNGSLQLTMARDQGRDGVFGLKSSWECGEWLQNYRTYKMHDCKVIEPHGWLNP